MQLLLLLSAAAVAASMASAFQVGSQGRVMWENNCDFFGNDRYSVPAIPDACGDLCVNDGGCTHWTWTNWNGGTCWLKQGAASDKVAVYGAGCGYAVGRAADPSANQENTNSASGNGLSAADSNQMLNRINTYRQQNGVGALTINARLTAAAAAHSNEQASRCTMTHDGADGSQPWERMTDAGYYWSNAAENVAAGQSTVDAVMTAWWNSDGHRKNILDPSMKEVGFAKGTNNGCSNYAIYWTQDFGNPQ
uniref:SCP domain-containing protein n=1 Tax=Globisporangium ultimum (strain ATCC 200006 / CBS 805.95 / DAOM BR144) TaxID=431595 RepID=K3X174_GLOUD